MAGPAQPVANAVTNLHSVFVLPTNPREGRDPFYPSSSRPYQAAVLPVAAATSVNLDSLSLQGISGLPPNRLAIINKHTFAQGDHAEVSTSQGRIHIHCLEIDANSAVIEVNGQRHELRYEEKQ